MSPKAVEPVPGKCNARAKQHDGLCGLPAGWGTKHPGFGACRKHGGNMPNHVVAARTQQAEQAVVTYGLPREVDPRTALEEELWRTAGHVDWLLLLIQGQGQEELLQYAPAGTYKSAVDGEDRALLWERPSIWLDLYHRERKHLKEVAKTCAEVGVEERRIQLAELIGGQFAQVIGGILRDLNVFDHPDAPAVVRRHLQVIEGTATDGTVGG